MAGNLTKPPPEQFTTLLPEGLIPNERKRYMENVNEKLTLHKATVPTVRAAVATELSYRNDTDDETIIGAT